jgi:hypothetical protein
VARNLGFHGWGHAERAVNPRKVIVHEIEAGGMPQILDFLAETIGQTGHTAHRHTHREILPLGIARGDVGKLGIPLNTLALHADTLRRALARFTVLRCPIQFNQHGIINVRTEWRFNGFQIGPVSIGRQLHPVFQSPGQVMHEH